CLLVVLIAALCLYMFVFRSGGAGDDTSDRTSESANSETGESEEASDISVESTEDISDSSVSDDTSPNESEETSHTGTDVSDESREEIAEHGWVINSLGYTYLYYGIGLEQFTYSSSTLDKYVSSLHNLNSVSGNSNFYHILVPTRCEFIEFSQEIKKEFYIANQRQFMNGVFENTDAEIKNIDLYNVFKEKYDNGEYIYFNTDPNYTHIAAYAAYAEYCKAAGITPISDSFYTAQTVAYSFYGKFYTATGAEMLYENSDIVYYYDIDEAYKSQISIYKSQGVVKKDGVVFFDVPSYCYYSFLSDEAAKIEITTKVNTGKSILVIGDSSAAPFVTFLVPHYDKITYINSSLCSTSILDLLSSGTYNDIVVINYNTTAARTVSDAQNILAGIVS
ncbi:MAG: DHHW family protein, partial [Eubacteriales bacterium]|nr:DHHW family protein [Eubacteriales bacterium]